MSKDRKWREDLSSRTAAQLHKKMQDDYAAFLAQRGLERSPSGAHRFALAMRHKDETYLRSVTEVVVELAGGLPDYWQG